MSFATRGEALHKPDARIGLPPAPSEPGRQFEGSLVVLLLGRLQDQMMVDQGSQRSADHWADPIDQMVFPGAGMQQPARRREPDWRRRR